MIQERRSPLVTQCTNGSAPYFICCFFISSIVCVHARVHACVCACVEVN